MIMLSSFFDINNWMAEATNLILGRFSIFLRFVRSYACELQFNWKSSFAYVILRTLFLEYKTQIGEKKILDNVFQSNCNSHA